MNLVPLSWIIYLFHRTGTAVAKHSSFYFKNPLLPSRLCLPWEFSLPIVEIFQNLPFFFFKAVHKYPQLMLWGRQEGWPDSVCSQISLCSTFLQTEQQQNFLLCRIRFMSWPRITAPDVLPQKQFKGRRNCEQIVFLVEKCLGASPWFPCLYLCENKGQFCFCFLHLLVV